jgi:hypothetical protein
MTDDLVKRLRSMEVFFMDGCISPVAYAAADRIEELQRELADANGMIECLEEEIVDLGYEIRELGNKQ